MDRRFEFNKRGQLFIRTHKRNAFRRGDVASANLDSWVSLA